jgi:hypothetical protein
MQPCKNCAERFTACWGNCPKDKRGEYGYKAWLDDIHKQQAVEKEYRHRRREDFRRSEECAWKNSKKGSSR